MCGENGSIVDCRKNDHNPCQVQLNRGVYKGLCGAFSEWSCISIHFHLSLSPLRVVLRRAGKRNGKSAVRVNVLKTKKYKLFCCAKLTISSVSRRWKLNFLTSLGKSTRPSALPAIVTSVFSSYLQQNRLWVQCPHKVFNILYSIL